MKIHILHGLGVGAKSVKSLETSLYPWLHGVTILTPELPHENGDIDVVRSLRSWIFDVDTSDVLIGVSFGGLVACAAQEIKTGLKVVCINTPTRSKDYMALPVAECQPGSRRVVFTSSQDLVIQGFNNWEGLCDAFYDLPFMGHDIKPHTQILAYLIQACIKGEDLDKAYHGIIEGHTPLHGDTL